jgi:hypothetical protein
VNLAYSSANDPSGLPKAIVDELELLAGAPVGRRLSYRIEQYVVDGGTAGKTRDAWLSYTSRPDLGDTSAALRVTAGEFTLPLPFDPETQRDTENHYAAFDQRVGANPFDLFEDKVGVDLAYGRPAGQGADVHLLALSGHDAQSGLPSDGLDRMIVARTGSRAFAISAYRYDGARPLAPVADRFSRQGFGVSALTGDAEVDGLVQSGADSSADGMGSNVPSHGGFVQLRWTASPRFFGVVRYDVAGDAVAGASRSLTASLIFRPYRNARFTLEDVISGGHHTPAAAWLFAY